MAGLLPKGILKGPSELKAENLHVGAQHNYEMKGVAMKNSGTQSYSLGAPGYQAPVRQQPCVV